MLTIRNVQLRVFEEQALEDFEGEVFIHLLKYFPVDMALLGQEQARRAIRYSRERAGLHGLTTQGEIVRYVDLTLSLGSRFDQDPLLPWAAAALAPREQEHPGERMERLHAQALDYLEQTAGYDGGHYTRAMLRAHRLGWGELPGDEDAAARMALLEHLYPEKLHLLSAQELASFETLLAQYAARQGLATPRAKATLAVLMFMLGSHVLEDPLYPWASAALARSMVGADKGLALYSAARDYLEQGLSLLRQGRSA